MADAEKKLLEKVAKLLEAQRELDAKSAEIGEELRSLLAGEPGIGAQLKQAEHAFERAWETRYQNGRYVWRYTQDRPQIKRLLKALGLEEFKARALAYVRNADPYFLRARHSFGLFVSSINQHAGITVDAIELTPPLDCKHAPLCKTEAEHTRKSAADLRR